MPGSRWMIRRWFQRARRPGEACERLSVSLRRPSVLAGGLLVLGAGSCISPQIAVPPDSAAGQKCVAEAHAVRYACQRSCGEGRERCLADARRRAEEEHARQVPTTPDPSFPERVVEAVIAGVELEKAKDRLERAERRAQDCTKKAGSQVEIQKCLEQYSGEARRAQDELDSALPERSTEPEQPTIEEIEAGYASACPSAFGCDCDESFGRSFERCGGTFETDRSCLLCR